MMVQQISEATRRARKPHQCGMCNATIQPGDHHHVSTNIFDGRVYDWRTCQPCERDGIVSWVYDWMSWPDEGVTYEHAAEWAPDEATWSKSGAERWAARNWLARNNDGEGE